MQFTVENLYGNLLFSSPYYYTKDLILYPILMEDILIFSILKSSIIVRKNSIFPVKNIIKMSYLDFLFYSYDNVELAKEFDMPLLPKYYSFAFDLLKLVFKDQEVKINSIRGGFMINGIEIRKINKKSLRNCLATLFQDYNKYQFTIKENIGFGSINNLDNIEKIKYSSKKGGADQFINCLPNKYSQQVGYWFEGGTQLSGGQWQKLGLSRLFMKDADCLILDEPTASLDPISELEIFKQLYKNSNEKINIIITHRFINTVFANKILVLKNGEIIEQGEHNALLRQNGFYKNMFDIQSKGITLN